MTYEISGRVSGQSRFLAGELVVRIFDRGVGPDPLLAETRTDPSGRYSASFTDEVFASRGKERPDVLVRVFRDQTLLVETEVHYDAAQTLAIDIELPAGSAGLSSEFETLSSLVGRYSKAPPAELRETETQRDLTFLARKTGWDARMVAMLALADQFSRLQELDGAVPSAFFYALLRAGVPANFDVICQLDDKRLTAVWEEAVAQGIIPQYTPEVRAGALAAISPLRIDKLLNVPAMDGAAPMHELLSLSDLGQDEQRTFAVLYAAHQTDLPTFWNEVDRSFGADTAARLQLHGELARVTLNNAQLVRSVEHHGDTQQLVLAGFHRAEKWAEVLTADIPVPSAIPGDEVDAKRKNYADFLAAQLRLAHPTAAVAEGVRSGRLKLTHADAVSSFLLEHLGRFEIGVHPIGQYIPEQSIKVAGETVTELKRLQRVYQMTPTDDAMAVVLDAKPGIDSAYEIARYDRQTFVETFGPQMGDDQVAGRIHDKAVQIHGAALNIAISYLADRNAVPLGAQPLGPGPVSSGRMLRPSEPVTDVGGGASVIAYPTLEKLFGSMDYTACEPCHSILSPAAYLVDLLQFLDHPPGTAGNAQDVLFARRPDIQHLPLTCENTETVLPYIDLVNETLEYFVANHSLQDYTGHDTGSAASEDLLASPQYVIDKAYTTLKSAWFPAPLPYNQPLESLRRYFQKADVPLQTAMWRLRQTNSLERTGFLYGWRDIYAEELGISRDEYRVLTDSSLGVNALYGLPASASLAGQLKYARDYCRRAGISYDELLQLLGTRFVNPGSVLIPKLKRLGVPVTLIKNLYTGGITPDDFLKELPQGPGAPDPARYSGNIVNWLKDDANYGRIKKILTINGTTIDISAPFEEYELGYALPDAPGLAEAEYLRLIRFIRLWRKTGWSVEATDAALCALFGPSEPVLEDVDTVAKLDQGFKRLLPRLAVAKQVMTLLGLNVARDLKSMLGCWSTIGTHGAASLYGQMFLKAALSQRDPVFNDNGYGEFLTYGHIKLFDHQQTLAGAFGQTLDEFRQIAGVAFPHDQYPELTVENVSAMFRYGWLARKLKLSVQDFLQLARLADIDPFGSPDIPSTIDPALGKWPARYEFGPPICHFIALVQALSARSLKPAAAAAWIWDTPPALGDYDFGPALDLARTLRNDFAAIDAQFSFEDDPSEAALRDRLAADFGEDVANGLMEYLFDKLATEVAYTHPSKDLERLIKAADSALSYNDFPHRLSQAGLMTDEQRVALLAVPNTSAEFKDAIQALYERGQDSLHAYFTLNAELRPLYEADRGAPPAFFQALRALEVQRSRERKRRRALQRLAAIAGLEPESAKALVDPSLPADAEYPLHALGQPKRPIMDDALAAEIPGISASCSYLDAAGKEQAAETILTTVDFGPSGASWPPVNVPSEITKIVATGGIEVPRSDYYNLAFDCELDATVYLELDDKEVLFTHYGRVYRNSTPLLLKADKVHKLIFQVEGKDCHFVLSWESKEQARQPIPGRYLYPAIYWDPLGEAAERLSKIGKLATTLHLHGAEIALLGSESIWRIDEDGWLNKIPVKNNATTKKLSAALVEPLWGLLDLARLKAAWLGGTPGDLRLLEVLQNPQVASREGGTLWQISGWNPAGLSDILARMGVKISDLTQVPVLRHVADAYTLVRTLATSAKSVVAATTNDPQPGTASAFEQALRARYDPSAWRDFVRPVNDELRALQRDALVAYVLQEFSQDPDTSHIDTPDKLFEYFLLDVQMAPCMPTSRIRNALSSVQLFVERCLLSLEPLVSARKFGADRAEQWAWMKRYRVWEANRKVFLFPENWLEPELRDDKSPLFKEIESQLLQSDITDENATSAIMTYLSKLTVVANMRVVATYVEERALQNELDNIVHVIATSMGETRSFYYRKKDHGAWTPWERIGIEIEDTPVALNVWDGRLVLFWLKVVKATPQESPVAPDGGPDDSNTVRGAFEITKHLTSTALRVNVSLILCWSQFLDGKWQAPRTSEVGAPFDFGTFRLGPGAFDRRKLNLRSLFGVAYEEALTEPLPAKGLIISVGYEENQDSAHRLLFLNSISAKPVSPKFAFGEPPLLYQYFEKPLTIRYLVYSSDFHTSVEFVHNVLGKSPRALSPVVSENEINTYADYFKTPFFIQNEFHSFYVTIKTLAKPAASLRRAGEAASALLPLGCLPPVPFMTSYALPQFLASHPLQWQFGNSGFMRYRDSILDSKGKVHIDPKWRK